MVRHYVDRYVTVCGAKICLSFCGRYVKMTDDDNDAPACRECMENKLRRREVSLVALTASSR